MCVHFCMCVLACMKDLKLTASPDCVPILPPIPELNHPLSLTINVTSTDLSLFFFTTSPPTDPSLVKFLLSVSNLMATCLKMSSSCSFPTDSTDWIKSSLNDSTFKISFICSITMSFFVLFRPATCTLLTLI